MMKIIDARDGRALERVLIRQRAADPVFDRGVSSIVEQVRSEGDGALVALARRFDGVPPVEINADDMRREAASVSMEVRRAIRQSARHIARVAVRQIPRPFAVTVAPGV